MPPRDRASYQASRLIGWLLTTLGRELRLARISAGMRQADVARELGTSKSRVSRVERGLVRTLSVEALARHAGVVGLRPYVNLYPAGQRLLDAPQLALLERFRQRLHPEWTWETEVPMPIPGDLRATDCRITIPGCAIAVEAFTRLAEYEAQTRSAQRKRRDLGADRLILLVAATRANRQALADAGAVAAHAFPMSTKAVMRALAEGRDPGADAIILL